MVIGTAQGQASLHPLLSSAHVFGEIVRVKPPGKDARRDVRSSFLFLFPLLNPSLLFLHVD